MDRIEQVKMFVREHKKEIVIVSGAILTVGAGVAIAVLTGGKHHGTKESMNEIKTVGSLLNGFDSKCGRVDVERRLDGTIANVMAFGIRIDELGDLAKTLIDNPEHNIMKTDEIFTLIEF